MESVSGTLAVRRLERLPVGTEPVEADVVQGPLRQFWIRYSHTVVLQIFDLLFYRDWILSVELTRHS